MSPPPNSQRSCRRSCREKEQGWVQVNKRTNRWMADPEQWTNRQIDRQTNSNSSRMNQHQETSWAQSPGTLQCSLPVSSLITHYVLTWQLDITVLLFMGPRRGVAPIPLRPGFSNGFTIPMCFFSPNLLWKMYKVAPFLLLRISSLSLCARGWCWTAGVVYWSAKVQSHLVSVFALRME